VNGVGDVIPHRGGLGRVSVARDEPVPAGVIMVVCVHVAYLCMMHLTLECLQILWIRHVRAQDGRSVIVLESHARPAFATSL